MQNSESGRKSADIAQAIVSSIGGMIAIAIMIALSRFGGEQLMMIPFTTSIVLMMAAPESPPANARRAFVGHLLSACAGFVVLWTMGSMPFAPAPAVGLAILLMMFTDNLHPPAGINAMIVATAAPSWTFLFDPVLIGATLLVVYAALFRRVSLHFVKTG